MALSTEQFNKLSRLNTTAAERGMHGSRDNIFLNKYIFNKLKAEHASAVSKAALLEPMKSKEEIKSLARIENLERKMVEFAIAGIGRNYSGTENSYMEFLKLFRQNLLNYESLNEINWSNFKTYVPEDQKFPDVL